MGEDQLGTALENADVVIIPTGVSWKLGMTRDNLFNINVGIVKSLSSTIAKYCSEIRSSSVTSDNLLSGKMAIQQAAMAMVPDVKRIGDVFAEQYYNVLLTDPSLIYKFYQDCSILGRPDPTSGHMLSVTTVERINQLITSVDYSGLNVEIKTVDSQDVKIKTVDSQASYNNGVLVLVNGSIIYRNSGKRTFTQSFFLAPQGRGRYFVLNDVVRYLDEESQQQRQNVLEDAAKAYPGAVVKSEPVAQGQNVAIEQSATVVVEDPAPVVEEVQNNDMEQKEVPQGSAGHKGSEIEDAHNVGQPGPAQETPVVVQDASKKSYASILKNNAAPSIGALQKPYLARTRDVPNSAKYAANVSISTISSSTPVNMRDDRSAKGSGCSVFINNLPVNVIAPQVEEELKKFGSIKPSGVQVKSKQGGGSSFAFVEFKEAASVQTAIEASPIVIGGRQAFIREKHPFIVSGFVNNRGGGGSLPGRASSEFSDARREDNNGTNGGRASHRGGLMTRNVVNPKS